MGWKENKKKHDDYVSFVRNILLGKYKIIKEDELVKQEIQKHLLDKYGWKERDYDIKLISKRKRKYHYRINPYSIIEVIDIKAELQEDFE